MEDRLPKQMKHEAPETGAPGNAPLGVPQLSGSPLPKEQIAPEATNAVWFKAFVGALWDAFEQCRKSAFGLKWLDRHQGSITALATVAIGILTWFYVSYSRAQWKTMERQIDVSERPWVFADVRMAQPLIFDQRGAVTGVNVSLANVGHSVAENTSVWSALLVDGVDDPLAEENRLCEEPKRIQKSSYGRLIFPGQRPIVEFQPAIAPPEKIRKGVSNPACAGNVAFHLVLCVDYKSPFDAKHHQTRNVFLLGWPDHANHDILMGFFDIRKMYDELDVRPSLNDAWAD